MWQDIVLAVVGFGFSVALVPTLRGKAKPHPLSSLTTFMGLTRFIAVYVSLHLWLTVLSTVLNAAMWGTLFIQAKSASPPADRIGK